MARTYLTKVTTSFPKDAETWIELAQILEENDLTGSLKSYEVAMTLLQENEEVKISPIIYNNIGSLHYM